MDTNHTVHEIRTLHVSFVQDMAIFVLDIYKITIFVPQNTK